MADLINKVFIIFTYFCIGLYIGKKNVESAGFWERIKHFPYRNQLTDEQITGAIMVTCALIWPWFVITEIIRKLRK